MQDPLDRIAQLDAAIDVALAGKIREQTIRHIEKIRAADARRKETLIAQLAAHELMKDFANWGEKDLPIPTGERRAYFAVKALRIIREQEEETADAQFRKMWRLGLLEVMDERAQWTALDSIPAIPFDTWKEATCHWLGEEIVKLDQTLGAMEQAGMKPTLEIALESLAARYESALRAAIGPRMVGCAQDEARGKALVEEVKRLAAEMLTPRYAPDEAA
jgi:hypothetical protein